jgi:hypothetical protein
MSGVFRVSRAPAKTSALPAFRWIYWREYTASEPAFRVHTEGSEIDRLKLHLTYGKREEKGLWWWANCTLSVSPKSTVRHHYARRLRRGLEDALKARGFATDGSLISREGEDGGKGLPGTLQLLGNAKAADAKWDNLSEQCLRMLDAVIKLQRCEQTGPAQTAIPIRRAMSQVRKQKGQQQGAVNKKQAEWK